MKYDFKFYENELYPELIRIVKNSYEWEYTPVGISRIEFSDSLNKIFCDSATSWEKTVGCYLDDNKLVACVWNEGCYDGTTFFLFDSKERAGEEDLLADMIKFAKTYGVGYKNDGKTRFINLFIPSWNKKLMLVAEKYGLIKGEWNEKINIFPFKEKQYDVKLPEGYSIIDGNVSTDVQLANVHRHSFGYGINDRATEYGHKAFFSVRQKKYYNKKLDLCVLDDKKRPVAMAIIWYDEVMPYCELEPLGVCWWERRKGIGSAILYEAMNRVINMYPKCKGMLGGDQQFYKSMGFEMKAQATAYYWETEVFSSWEKESLYKDYGKEVKI